MTHTDAAREAARQDNGQFGTQARGEADVELSDVSPEKAALITGLRDAGLTGPIEPLALDSLTYTDDRDGNRYDIVTYGDSFQVRSEDTDSFSLVLPFNQKPVAPEKIAFHLREVIRNAGETRAFATVADQWAATRGDGFSDYTLDAESGVLSGNGWTIDGFTTTLGEHADTEMRVCLTDPDLDEGLTFYYGRGRDGETRVWREGSGDPLTRWEEAALDGRLMALMHRDGYARPVRVLFNSAVRACEKRQARG